MDEQPVEQLEFQPRLLENDLAEVKKIIEGILFASNEPVDIPKLYSVLKEDFAVNKKDLISIMNDLKEDYSRLMRSFELVETPDGFQLKTKAAYSRWIQKSLKERSHDRLSKSALETLAIIAYKQPVTRAEIEDIRGVNIDSAMKILVEKDLVFASGKKDIPGKPWQYSTTKNFLISFGLKSTQELPPLGELNLN